MHKTKAKFFKGEPKWANDDNMWLLDQGKMFLEMAVLIACIAVIAIGLVYFK